MSSAGQPGIPDGVIAAGALLPDADLLDPFGASVRLHDAIGDQPAVVVLYRGRNGRRRSLMEHLATDATGEIWNVNSASAALPI